MSRPWRWLPRSSFGRVALSVGVILLLAQLATGLLFRVYVITPHARHSGELLGRQLHFARDLLHSDHAAAVGQALLQSGAFLITQSRPAPVSAWPRLRYYQLLLDGIRKQLGPNSPVLLLRDGEQTVWTPLHDGRGWVGVPLLQPETTLGLPIAIWVLLVVIASLGVATFTVRQLDRSLRRLADAARRFGGGETPVPLTPTGSEEVRSLTDSFNHMVADLSQQEEQRRLFLAGVSHDLRTPLTRQRLSLEMMSAQDPALQAEALRNIDDMEGIVARFMDYLQGEQQEQVQPMDLNQLLRDVASPYQRRGLALQLSLSEVAPLRTMRLRPQAMRRLLTNLIDNAERHAAANGPVVITTELRAGTGNGRCCLRVLDSGPGIAEAEIPQALRPYGRLNKDSAMPGSGLGLAIVARIARLEGFTLSLSNREGGGLSVELCR